MKFAMKKVISLMLVMTLIIPTNMVCKAEEIESYIVSIDESSYIYNGSAQMPSFEVQYTKGDNTTIYTPEIIDEMEDMSYYYLNNINASSEEEKAKIVITKKIGDSYQIVATKNFIIEQFPIEKISEYPVSFQVEYNGGKYPIVTGKWNIAENEIIELVQGRDFSIVTGAAISLGKTVPLLPC